METTSPQRIVSVAALLVGAVTLGMVLTGGLNMTPTGNASHLAPALATTAQATTAAPAPAATGYPDFASLADRVVPSVISVYTTDVVTGPEMRQFHRDIDPFEFFFGPRGAEPNQLRPAGAGSGVLHLGRRARPHQQPRRRGRRRHRGAARRQRRAQGHGGRPRSVDRHRSDQGRGRGSVLFLSLGDSDSLRVGEWVMAVGNPLNMAHTVTVGVVSAKGRALGLLETSFENFIQTDAAINLGNSGGPLVNLHGQVVGINSAINLRPEHRFRDPGQHRQAVLPQLQKKGKVVRGYLGVIIKNVDEDNQESFKLPSRDGALVEDLESDGPADKAGIEAGDIIVTVDGQPVKETRQLIDRVSALPPERKVELDVIRDGNEEVHGRARRAAVGRLRGEEAPSEDATPVGKLGIEVDEIDARLRRDSSSRNVSGIVVTEVEPLSGRRGWPAPGWSSRASTARMSPRCASSPA